MARKNKDGTFTISAAEVGTFSVCPESWRLKVVEGFERSSKEDTVIAGNKMHEDWAEKHKEEIFLQKGINMILLLLANAIVLGLFVLNV